MITIVNQALSLFALELIKKSNSKSERVVKSDMLWLNKFLENKK